MLRKPLNSLLRSRQFNPFARINFTFPLQPHQKYNITQSGELMAFHSLLGWKIIVIPILSTSCDDQRARKKCLWMGYYEMHNAVYLNILVSRLLTFTGWLHKLYPGQRTLSWETITIYLLLCIVRQSWHVYVQWYGLCQEALNPRGLCILECNLAAGASWNNSSIICLMWNVCK